MTRNFLRRVARGLVGVVLLAQLSIAAYACPGISSALQASRQATNIGTAKSEPADAAALRMARQAPACDDMAGAMDPTSLKLKKLKMKWKVRDMKTDSSGILTQITSMILKKI